MTVQTNSVDSDASRSALAILIGADTAMLDDVRAKLNAPVALAALSVDDWNAALSPWPAPGLRAKEPFTGGAHQTLERLMAQLPSLRNQAEAELGVKPAYTFLVGYSLAGLCALWITAQTNEFQGVGSVSGSIWYDGFCEYMAAHPPQAHMVYLSLGKSEPRARNPRLARVGECTQAMHDLLARNAYDVTFEWNSGNHFNDASGRIARCVYWLWAHCDG